jgi:hypothetical protein
MSQQLGNIASGQTLTFLFPAENPNGVPVAPTTPGDVYVYKDNGTTETAAGVTYTPSFDGVDGVNLVKIETTDDFYATGHNYSVVLIGAVIPGVLGFGPATINTVLAEFSIENRLAPTTLPSIDGLDPEKVLAAVLATAAGKVTVTDNGDGTYTAVFKRQDGTTTALSVTYNPATGTRAVTAAIP